MNISDDIRNVGVNDHDIDLFEGQYRVPLGMAYNSYAILDESVAVMDAVDARFGGARPRLFGRGFRGHDGNTTIVSLFMFSTIELGIDPLDVTNFEIS